MDGRVMVIGSANMDMVVRCERIPAPGETVLGGEFVTAQGGKGANQAVAAARLGAQVAFVASVGDDSFGEQARANYDREGIDTRYVAVQEGVPTGVALITVDEQGENAIAVATGANARLTREMETPALATLTDRDMALLQLEIPMPVVEHAAQQAKAAGATVILNPAPAVRLSAELLASVSILTPNESEVRQLAAMSGTGTDDLRAAGAALVAAGPEAVIITRGSRGALIVTESGSIPVPAFSVKAVDTTAAGDAFNGALAAALAEGRELAEAVRFACAAGALAATWVGAQPSLPTREEVRRLVEGSV